MPDATEPLSLIDSMQERSDFLRLLGCHVEEATPTRLAGWFEAGPQHHQPFGIMHGGVYAAVVETFASIGAWLAVRDAGMSAVGVSNTTDFLRPERAGRMTVVARALHQGRTQQLWEVVISRASDGRDVALGRVRLHNISTPS